MDTSKQPRHFKCIKRDIKKLSKNLLIQVIRYMTSKIFLKTIYLVITLYI